MIGYIYDNFINDNDDDEYEYFYFCGDVTYLIVENLKYFLHQAEIQIQQKKQQYSNEFHSNKKKEKTYFYTGSWIHPTSKPSSFTQKQYRNDDTFYYMGGGARYILNKQIIISLIEIVFPLYHPKTKSSEEDVLMGYCLRKYLNVTGYDSRDNSDDNVENDDEIDNLLLSSSKGGDEGRGGERGRGKERFFWMDIVYQSEVKEKSIKDERKLLSFKVRYWRKQQQWQNKYQHNNLLIDNSNNSNNTISNQSIQQQQQQQQQHYNYTNIDNNNNNNNDDNSRLVRTNFPLTLNKEMVAPSHLVVKGACDI